MSDGDYLTYDDFLAMFDEEDIKAIAGIGGYNSSVEREIDKPRIEKVIARAKSRIDGYVLARFPTLAETAAETMPEALKGAAGDMVHYWLRDREGDRGTVDDVVKTRFNDAIKYLEGIQSGKIDLGVSGGENADGSLGAITGSFPVSRAKTALDGYLT